MRMRMILIINARKPRYHQVLELNDIFASEELLF